MDLFNLPQTTKVQRVIPKNAFDAYSNSRQKKLFSELISRITWLHKLSSDTINLDAKEIAEIQIFKVELKVNSDIQAILDVIDKSIPYTIIFIVEYLNSIYLSTTIKHQNPVGENNAVLDWTFKTSWFLPSENPYQLLLNRSLDAVYKNLCVQISGKPELLKKSFEEIVQYQHKIHLLIREIDKLKSRIAKSKQFNEKVALNLKLNEMVKELANLEQ